MSESGKDPLWDRIVVGALPGLRRFLSGRSNGGCERIGNALGLAGYCLDGKHRRRTRQNLQLAFPEWSDRRRTRTGLEMYRHFGRAAIEFLRIGTAANADLEERMQIVGTEHFERCSSKGKGVLAVTAHYGTWELGPTMAVKLGAPMTVVARAANQRGIQREVTAIREAGGATVITRGDSVREILRSLKSGRMVAILADQNSTDCFVPFFDKPCGTSLGPAVLHQRSGAPLLPLSVHRTGVGTFVATAYEPVDFDNAETDPATIMAKISERLESIVRSHPEQYLWMHDRWKSARRAGLI